MSNTPPKRYLRTVSEKGEEILHTMHIEMLNHYWQHQWLDNREAITALLVLMGEFGPQAQQLQQLDAQLSREVEHLARDEVAAEADPIKVAMMVEDGLVQAGIKSQLAGQDDLLLVGEIATAENLYSLLANTKPDVLLFGAHVPQTERHPLLPLRLVKALHKVGQDHPRVAIILLARYYLPLAERTLTRVRGYVLHGDKAAHKLASAVRTVHQGGKRYSRTVRRELFSPQARQQQQESRQLERVQVAILSLLASAPHADESRHAEALGMTEAAYEMHLQRAFRALRVTDKLSAVLRALQLGILRVEELG